MKPATLPPSFRSVAHACAATDLPHSALDGIDQEQLAALEMRRELVNRVCDRAKRLSDRQKLTGRNADEIADQIYGSSLIWLFWLWQYRSLIWQVIRVLAELANRERQERRWRPNGSTLR